jgi:uncharacterized lipoprotein YmbA
MRSVAILAMVLAVSGCSIFKRPQNQFYALSTIPAAAPAAAAGGTPIGIEGIELPPTLARRGIVVRDENGKLEVRGTHQWASPLEDMVAHTLGFNLADRLPEGMIVLPGQPRPAGTVRPLAVIFEELAPGPDNVFVLDARWTIGTDVHQERITITQPSDESSDVVLAMSQALATLADRIAASL